MLYLPYKGLSLTADEVDLTRKTLVVSREIVIIHVALSFIATHAFHVLSITTAGCVFDALSVVLLVL
jgi:hypothetical protein